MNKNITIHVFFRFSVCLHGEFDPVEVVYVCMYDVCVNMLYECVCVCVRIYLHACIYVFGTMFKVYLI
jgi:hypothetical protein